MSSVFDFPITDAEWDIAFAQCDEKGDIEKLRSSCAITWEEKTFSFENLDLDMLKIVFQDQVLPYRLEKALRVVHRCLQTLPDTEIIQSLKYTFDVHENEMWLPMMIRVLRQWKLK